MSINNQKLLNEAGLDKYDTLIKAHINKRITESLNAKTTTYVIQDYSQIFTREHTGNNDVNGLPIYEYVPITSPFYDQKDGIAMIRDRSKGDVVYSQLNVGDVILVVAQDQPDYWVINTSENTLATLSILETRTINLENYYTKQNTYNKGEVITLLGNKADTSVTNEHTTTLSNHTIQIGNLQTQADLNNEILTNTEIETLFNGNA